MFGDNKEYKKCKGTAKHIVKINMTYEEYNKILETNKSVNKTFNTIS